MRERELHDAFAAFITGRGAPQTRLELVLDGKQVEDLFIEALRRFQYRPMTVAGCRVEPGERVPGFYIEGATAFFGWVFWEKFSERRMRKLWGSVVRNRKGDWAIQIPESKSTLIYLNPDLKTTMDIDHPV